MFRRNSIERRALGFFPFMFSYGIYIFNIRISRNVSTINIVLNIRNGFWPLNETQPDLIIWPFVHLEWNIYRQVFETIYRIFSTEFVLYNRLVHLVWFLSVCTSIAHRHPLPDGDLFEINVRSISTPTLLNTNLFSTLLFRCTGRSVVKSFKRFRYGHYDVRNFIRPLRIVQSSLNLLKRMVIQE